MSQFRVELAGGYLRPAHRVWLGTAIPDSHAGTLPRSGCRFLVLLAALSPSVMPAGPCAAEVQPQGVAGQFCCRCPLNDCHLLLQEDEDVKGVKVRSWFSVAACGKASSRQLPSALL